MGIYFADFSHLSVYSGSGFLYCVFINKGNQQMFTVTIRFYTSEDADKAAALMNGVRLDGCEASFQREAIDDGQAFEFVAVELYKHNIDWRDFTI